MIAVLENIFFTQFSVNLQNNLSSSQKKWNGIQFCYRDMDVRITNRGETKNCSMMANCRIICSPVADDNAFDSGVELLPRR